MCRAAWRRSSGSLNKLEENKKEAEVRLVVKHSGVGNITESDMSAGRGDRLHRHRLQRARRRAAQKAAERDGVDVRLYNIIYDLVEDMDRAMKGLLTPIYEEFPLGKAEVRQRFQTPKGIVIAGRYVTEGKIVRGAEVRVLRGKEQLLPRAKSTRCAVSRTTCAKWRRATSAALWCRTFDVQPGDILECFEMRVVPRA